MQIVDFKERTVIIAEDQPEYIPVPAHQVKDPQGTTFFRVQFDADELAELNRTGGFWMSQLTFNKPFTPFMVYAKHPFPYLQPITREISAIYFKDLDQVVFYTPDGNPIITVSSDLFGQWIEVQGYDTFKFYRIKQIPKPGSLIGLDGKREMLTTLHVTYDKEVGGSKLLNNQLYYKDDNENIIKP